VVTAIATAVNADGRREILGVDVAAVLLGGARQRSRVHFVRNL
jgi:transposase-like protein